MFEIDETRYYYSVRFSFRMLFVQRLHTWECPDWKKLKIWLAGGWNKNVLGGKISKNWLAGGGRGRGASINDQRVIWFSTLTRGSTMKRRHFSLFRAFFAISNLIKMLLFIFISTSSNFYDLFLFNSGTFFNMYDFAVHLVWWRNKTYLDTFLYRSKCIH